MASTYTCSPFNSTPFSSCCGVASMTDSGRPADKCARCGEALHFHDSGVPRGKPGCCLMCGRPRGDPAVSGNCHC